MQHTHCYNYKRWTVQRLFSRREQYRRQLHTIDENAGSLGCRSAQQSRDEQYGVGGRVW